MMLWLLTQTPGMCFLRETIDSITFYGPSWFEGWVERRSHWQARNLWGYWHTATVFWKRDFDSGVQHRRTSSRPLSTGQKRKRRWQVSWLFCVSSVFYARRPHPHRLRSSFRLPHPQRGCLWLHQRSLRLSQCPRTRFELPSHPIHPLKSIRPTFPPQSYRPHRHGRHDRCC